MKEHNITTIIQHLETQLDHRLAKLWKIFSWTSSLFIGIIGGILFLTRIQEKALQLSDRILISAVILILTFYAYQWIKENLRFEGIIRKQLDRLFSENVKYNRINEIRPHEAKYGYIAVVLSLGTVSMFATWSDFFFN